MIEWRNSITGLFLAILAILSWLLIASLESKEERIYSSSKHTPDYFLEEFNTIEMNKEGNPLKRIRAEKMTHYPDDDSTEIIKPNMVIYSQIRPPWKIKADTGWLSGDGRLLYLKGDVSIDRDAAVNFKPVHIVTSNLRIEPKENYAETDEKIHIKSLKNWVTSVGMQAWFANPMRLKLLSKVRGKYEVK